jgi:hypothetical protein
MSRMSATEFRRAIAPKTRKYRNEPIVVDGVRFDSKRESVRWCALRLMERSGDIKGLRRQVRYPLVVDGTKIGEYIADFEYEDTATRALVTEDVKSDATEKIALFQWKAKHFAVQYGREIRVTK